MPINVHLKEGVDDTGDLGSVIAVGLPWGVIEDHREEFPLMRGIDPYSDTYFGELQMRDLLVELERLMPLVDLAVASQLGDILTLARSGSTRPHHYLVFKGD